MHPQIRQIGAGSCPICGMDLVPASSAGGGQDEYAVHVTPAARRLAGIETAPAVEEHLTRTVKTVGMIRIDESRQAVIAAYTAGRIEQMFADYTGVEVRKGDHLVVLYSPTLYAAQAEFVEARRSVAELSSGGLAAVVRAQQKLVASTRRRLVELGMTEDQVADLEKSDEPQARLTIYSPIAGTVTGKKGVRGEYVDTGEPIYEIANLGTVWLMLELFPEDAAHVRFGQQVEAELPSLPGRSFDGRVAFVDPTVDPKTRTVGVRVEFLNPDGSLRPGDYATADVEIPLGREGEVYDAALAGKWISPMHPQVIRDSPGDCPICGMSLVPTSRYGYADTSQPRPKVLAVPRSAVLKVAGTSVVYVETEAGMFEARRVKLGPAAGDKIAILDGLAKGDEVAVAGNFLLDSQAQLDSKPSLIDPEYAVPRKKDGPLELAHVHVERLGGDSGSTLERMFAAYLDAQIALAADTVPSEAVATALAEAAEKVIDDPDTPAELRALAGTIGENAGRLHQPNIAQAREAFKPVSHAAIRIAAKHRGDGGKPLLQMYCPMVKGGGGDWLQATTPLANPYWGDRMLRCGDTVRTLPSEGHPE